MFIITRLPTKAELKQDVKELIAGANKFLKANPDRKECRGGVPWPGVEAITLRRGHVRADAEAAAKKVKTRRG